MAIRAVLLVDTAVQQVNLYVHFPFCRSKCAYCALKSRAGSTAGDRAAYVARIADEVRKRVSAKLDTVYFGGGTPALCDLRPLFDTLRGNLAPDAEFTVELHPSDVTPDMLACLAEGGVNRISLGVQSFDEATLARMGRRHTSAEAVEAFESIRRVFPNSGFDLIVGYPVPAESAPLRTWLTPILERLCPAHVSVYSLIREPGTLLDRDVRQGKIALPDDDVALDEVAEAERILDAAGLRRYEISNYARPGMECRHNCAVWRGEDYLGLGDGAHGREGFVRTTGEGDIYSRETLSPLADALERELLALRTRWGFDPDAAIRRHPVLEQCRTAWMRELAFDEAQGLVFRRDGAYVLTSRGREVCDAVTEGLYPLGGY